MMESNKNIIITEEKIVATIGNTQITQTADKLTIDMESNTSRNGAIASGNISVADHLIIDKDSIIAAIGNIQATHTPDGVTFTRLDSGEYLIVPGSGIPTLTSLDNCDPHFGVDYSTATDYTISPGEISDGYHTFNELYEHRTALFAVICRLFPELSWRSCLHPDGTMFDGMFIAGIRTPDGDYSYHCENKYWSMFDQVPELTRAPEWDGHQPKDFPRLFSLLSIDDVEPDDVDWGRLAWNEGDE